MMKIPYYGIKKNNLKYIPVAYLYINKCYYE